MDGTSVSILDSLKTNNFEADINSAKNFEGESSSSFLGNIPWYGWLILILIITFLGFSLYMYLAKENDPFGGFFSNVTAKIRELLGMPDTYNSPALPEQKIEPVNIHDLKQDNDSSQKTTLFKALNATQPEESAHKEKTNYHEDDTSSAIQQNKTSSKSGWCYIGEDRGIRSCAKVNESDTCMSGSIFPSQDLCVNPNLRA